MGDLCVPFVYAFIDFTGIKTRKSAMIRWEMHSFHRKKKNLQSNYFDKNPRTKKISSFNWQTVKIFLEKRKLSFVVYLLCKWTSIDQKRKYKGNPNRKRQCAKENGNVKTINKNETKQNRTEKKNGEEMTELKLIYAWKGHKHKQ